ncbi:MAG: dihydropteroate synthase [Longimicrobiales bacterium]
MLGDRRSAAFDTPAPPPHWRTSRGALTLDRPRILGILNLTPDSFWDGGRHARLAGAVAHVEQMIEDGADVIDVGGESTRPGAESVSAEEEIARVVPLIESVARRWPDLPVSIDTVKLATARAALDAGAAAINDVSGLRLAPELASLAAARGAGLVLMHSRGDVATMARYELAEYGADPVGDMVEELRRARDQARAAGVAHDALALDPGLGFSKRTEHSAAALRELGRFTALGQPVLVGPSRKRFLGELAGGLDATDRLEPTLAACVVALANGARLFRVHDVREVRRALDTAYGIWRPA